MSIFRRKSSEPVQSLAEAEDIYREIISYARSALSEFDPERPLYRVLARENLGEMANQINESHREPYTRSRFIGNLLWGIARVQILANRERMFRLENNPSTEKRDFAATLESPDVRKALTEGLGGAVAMLARDPDVDIKVAQDLDRSEPYPARDELPDPAAGADFYQAAHRRVIAFWRHILPVPVPEFFGRL